ncbi:PAAR domain-containing protein [Burkholderia aenigmatica]|uniref:PAAR domain-containing protein n=2 Tax=Burkholderia TaxID=32008 RepID=UPI002AAC2D11|nr:PAAR domain-containing protein [Burkholderia aenigmatica]
MRTWMAWPATGAGHMVSCPKCGDSYPIVQGANRCAIDDGAVALDGMKTACGAKPKRVTPMDPEQ